MRRGRRDFESNINDSNAINSNNGTGNFKRKHLNPKPYNNSSRFSHSRSNHNPSRHAQPSQHIAGIVSSKLSDSDIRSAPSLQTLRDQSSQLDDWPWDKKARGFEHLNVSVLKLFGIANVGVELSKLPPELEKLRALKPLTCSNSWIYRKVGEQVFPDLISASNAVAEHRHENGHERPIIPEVDSAITANLTGKTMDVLLDLNTIITYDKSIEQIQAHYNEVLKAYFPLKNAMAVLFPSPMKPKDNDIPLFTPQSERGPKQVIQILNAVPLNESDDLGIETLVTNMCSKLGVTPERVWLSSMDQFHLTRVYVQLPDPSFNNTLATQLGDQRICGRPLITNITSQQF